MEAKTTPRAPRAWPVRLLRAAGLVVLGVVLLVVLVFLLLALPPVRSTVLGVALGRAQDALPGELAVARIAWPKLARLELEGIGWTAEGDTLAAVDRLVVDVALRPLLERELRVRELTLAGARGDLPRIRMALPPTGEAVEAEPAEAAAAGLPLRGLAIDSLGVDARLRLDPDRSVEAEIRSGGGQTVSLRAATTAAGDPEIDLAGTLDWSLAPLGARLEAAGSLSGREIERLFVAADLPDGPGGTIEAELEVAVAEAAVHTRAVVDLSDGVRVVIAPILVRRAGEPEQPVAGRDGAIVVHEGDVEVTGVTIGGALGEIVANASVRTGEAGVSGSAELELDVAGPRDLAAIFPAALPESLRVDDLGNLRGSLRGTFATGGGAPEFEGRLDLSGTEWLASGLVVVHGAGGTVDVDTLSLAMEGLAVEASGELGETIDARLRVELPDASFVSRLPALRGAELDLVLEATARGPREAPDLTVSLAGGGSFEEASVPVLALDVSTRGDSVDVALDLPEGATYAEQSIDHLALDAALPFPPPEHPGGRLFLEATAEDLGVTLGLRADLGDTLTVEVDTLGVRLGDQSLESQGPFRVRRATDSGAMLIENLRLEGAMGRIVADAGWSNEELRGDLEIAVAATVDDLAKLLPDAALPREHGLTISLEGTARARGTPAAPVLDWTSEVSFGGHPQLDSLRVTLDVRAAGDGSAGEAGLPAVKGVSGRLLLRRPDRDLLRATVRLPAEISLAPVALRPSANDTLRIELRSEPIPLADLGPLLPPGITLGGQLQVEADVRRAMDEEVLQLSGFTELTGFRFDSDDGSWAEARGRIDLAGTSRRPRVEGKMTVDGGVIVLPEAPPSLLPTEGEAILWSEASEVAIEIDPAALAASGSGVAPDSALAASASAAVPDSAQVASASTAVPDSARAATGGRDTPGSAGPAAAEAFAPELAVVIDCPGTVHLRGQGLSLDLSGKLDLEYRQEPVIVGELKAVRGTFRFLGRQFQVSRGVVTFYGDPDTDPVLDLTLEARISGTTYRVAVTGEAASPKLELSSDPEMSDGDIVASILFGKPLDQLDSGQENLLQARMIAVLAQYGAESVSGDVTRTLGVDMISYNEASDGSGSGALTVGKYLNPRTLVKYEQIIDREIAYLLRLEYALTETIKVETAFGQGTASGVDLQWSKDY